MRRINIVKDKKIETRSFVEKSDLVTFIKNHNSIYFYDFKEVLDASENIWNLNVGSSVEFFGYRFAIQSKARVGNQLVL